MDTQTRRLRQSLRLRVFSGLLTLSSGFVRTFRLREVVLWRNGFATIRRPGLRKCVAACSSRKPGRSCGR
eukprot:1116738-Alexandrium_andersonii.AAC.1